MGQDTLAPWNLLCGKGLGNFHIVLRGRPYSEGVVQHLLNEYHSMLTAGLPIDRLDSVSSFLLWFPKLAPKFKLLHPVEVSSASLDNYMTLMPVTNTTWTAAKAAVAAKMSARLPRSEERRVGKEGRTRWAP